MREERGSDVALDKKGGGRERDRGRGKEEKRGRGEEERQGKKAICRAVSETR